jgi:hypothetical protein
MIADPAIGIPVRIDKEYQISRCLQVSNNQDVSLIALFRMSYLFIQDLSQLPADLGHLLLIELGIDQPESVIPAFHPHHPYAECSRKQ